MGNYNCINIPFSCQTKSKRAKKNSVVPLPIEEVINPINVFNNYYSLYTSHSEKDVNLQSPLMTPKSVLTTTSSGI